MKRSTEKLAPVAEGAVGGQPRTSDSAEIAEIASVTGERVLDVDHVMEAITDENERAALSALISRGQIHEYIERGRIKVEDGHITTMSLDCPDILDIGVLTKFPHLKALTLIGPLRTRGNGAIGSHGLKIYDVLPRLPVVLLHVYDVPGCREDIKAFGDAVRSMRNVRFVEVDNVTYSHGMHSGLLEDKEQKPLVTPPARGEADFGDLDI